jgi:TrmH family RNA methyltransferase
MTLISSRENPIIKHIQKLNHDRAYRQEYREFVIEGPKAFAEAKKIKTILVKESYLNKPDQAFVVSDILFKQISQTEHDQGIMAVCGMTPVIYDPKKSYVLLDRLQDPGNLGTIIRTAVGFGVEGILITKGTVDPYSPKVVRSTMGALFHLDIVFIDTFEGLRSVYAADMSGIPVSNVKRPFVLAIGNEGQGIDQKLLKQAEKKIGISTKSIESLNAAVACGILLYEMTKKE